MFINNRFKFVVHGWIKCVRNTELDNVCVQRPAVAEEHLRLCAL